MSKKWELLDVRFYRALKRAQNRYGHVSLLSIARAQYFYPGKYTLQPAKIKFEPDEELDERIKLKPKSTF